MQSIDKLFDFARLADAAYIKFISSSEWSNLNIVRSRAEAQARMPLDFASSTFTTTVGGWQIVGYDDSDNNSSGFAGTLFKSTEGKYVLALRGTETGDGGTDLKADLKEIGFIGLALSQAVSMVNWVLRLQAPAGWRDHNSRAKAHPLSCGCDSSRKRAPHACSPRSYKQARTRPYHLAATPAR